MLFNVLLVVNMFFFSAGAGDQRRGVHFQSEILQESLRRDRYRPREHRILQG